MSKYANNTSREAKKQVLLHHRTGAKNGESFVVEFGKQHKKVAVISPYIEEPKQRVFGQLKGKLVIPDNFNDESDEINEMFYGK